MPGYAAYRLWGRDERPTFPDDGSPHRTAPHRADAYFPPRGGSRFMVNSIPPAKSRGYTTDSIDYVVVVSGEVTLEFDDGEQTVVRADDVVIQNGTRHAWRNHGTESCTIVGVAIGADRIRLA